MRIQPDDEMFLVAEHKMLRLLCNWWWPLISLVNIVHGLFRIFAWQEFGPLDALFGVFWYFALVWLWRKDVGKLRDKRRLLREIHDEA